MTSAPTPSGMPKTAARQLPQIRRKPITPLFDTPAAAVRPAPDEAAAEQRRWLLMLITPFIVGASFFAAAIGTGKVWLIGPAIGIGVMCVIFAFIYLILTSSSSSN